jgi:hypothetical protein
MSLNLFGKKPEDKKDDSEEDSSDAGTGKYSEQCSLCGKGPTDKHWAGQYFHKKCLRKIRKGAKGML